MKILIGTPIHEVKDYCMERWLENVAKLQKLTPTHLLLVDNSSGLDYVKKVKKYCQKYGVKNYRIEHFELDEKGLDEWIGRSQRVEIAQEMIRRVALQGDYNAWFSWECDQIIPETALGELVRVMQMGNYMMVVANSWAREIPDHFNTNMGVTLIDRRGFEKGWFLPEKDGVISREASDSYDVDETMFKKRILKNHGNYVELFGVINPIYHLNK